MNKNGSYQSRTNTDFSELINTNDSKKTEKRFVSQEEICFMD